MGQTASHSNTSTIRRSTKRRARTQRKLSLAVSQDNLFKCQEIVLDENFDLCKRNVDARNQPVLHDAALNGHLQVLEFLLANGSNINERNRCGETALHQACYVGRLDITKLLLSNQAAVNLIDRNGQTCLHYAATYNHTCIAKALLDADSALLDVKDGNGWTALVHAAEWSQNEVAELLINRGACAGFELALQVARKRGNTKLVALLEHWQIAHAIWALRSSSTKRAAKRASPVQRLPFEMIWMVHGMLK